MIFKTFIPSFVFSLFFLINFTNNQANGMRITTSTNATSVPVGTPFSMRCEVTDLAGPLGSASELKIIFYYKLNGQFATYTVPASTSSSSERSATFELLLNDGDRPYLSRVQPLGHTFPTYEISVTPRSLFATDFNCYWSYNGTSSFNSNNVHLTVTADPSPPTTPTPSALPTITLTSNESTLHLGEPFTVTCTIVNFAPGGKKYQVNYFNTRNGLLAGYEVDESGKSLLSAGEFDAVTTRFGSRSSFPAFDLVITERADRKQTYWCELVADIALHKKYPSPSWNLTGPFVDFTSTGGGTTEQKGRCTIDELERYTELEYQVLFYSDLGPRSAEDNLLGFFWLRANKVMEFAYEHLSPWTSIAHGPGIAYPNFEIVTKLNSSVSVNRWWCVLNIGVPGQPPLKRPIKSNLRLL